MEDEENKPIKQFYRISEVAKMLGVEPSTLRYWEKEFKDLKPLKNKKGDRIYRLTDIEVAKNIKYLTHEKGLKISKASKKVKTVITNTDEKNEILIEKLKFLKEQLIQIKLTLNEE